MWEKQGWYFYFLLRLPLTKDAVFQGNATKKDIFRVMSLPPALLPFLLELVWHTVSHRRRDGATSHREIPPLFPPCNYHYISFFWIPFRRFCFRRRRYVEEWCHICFVAGIDSRLFCRRKSVSLNLNLLHLSYRKTHCFQNVIFLLKASRCSHWEKHNFHLCPRHIFL